MPSGKYIRDENWKNKMRDTVWNNPERNNAISAKNKGRSALWAIPPIMTEEIKQKISIARKGQHNSPLTEFNSERTKSQNNPQWKGGRTNILHRYRGWKEYQNWRQTILNKYDNTCQRCNILVKGKNAHIHHLESYKNNPLLRLDLNNGTVLCAKCHASQTMKENKEKFFEGRNKWLLAREETKLKGLTYK